MDGSFGLSPSSHCQPSHSLHRGWPGGSRIAGGIPECQPEATRCRVKGPRTGVEGRLNSALQARRAVVKPGVKNSNYRVLRRNRIAPRPPFRRGQSPHPIREARTAPPGGGEPARSPSSTRRSPPRRRSTTSRRSPATPRISRASAQRRRTRSTGDERGAIIAPSRSRRSSTAALAPTASRWRRHIG